ncbi:MAG: hypothetical protein ACFN01_02425 [Capnocytophaga leadbetteri]|jgi:hypothetical protein|uniref:hypothetical protein n=1 Tax=Capnocytophaga leadbetteri TaxID=327575 RepID=UPI0028E2B6C8|nr:hypothetical protein [Capnocytophaga leadbetteri]
MNATVSPSIEPLFLIDEQGNYTHAVLPIEKYNSILRLLEEKYDNDFDYFPPEVLEALSIAKEQSRLGMTISNEDLFKEIEEKRIEKWK